MYLHIYGHETISDIVSFGDLTKLGLPLDELNVHIVLVASSLSKFLPTEQQEIKFLFEEFNDIFAKHYKDLILAKGVYISLI